MAAANQVLEESLQLAASGDLAAAKKLFIAFLDGPLFVPERFQSQPLSDLAEYPDPFLNVLAIQNGEQATVPVFSNKDLIAKWCGNPLRYRSLTGIELSSLIPEDWWISINPGSSIGKELSPWEVEQLKLGKEAIPALIEENFPADQDAAFTVQAVKAEELSDLKDALINTAKNRNEILKLYLLRELKSSPGEKSDDATLLLGVETKLKDEKQHAALRDELTALCKPYLIGAEDLSVILASKALPKVSFKIFKTLGPIYSKKGFSFLGLSK